jgi:cell division protein ZapA
VSPVAVEEPVTRVTVRIVGEEYALRGDGDPAYLEMLAGRIDARIRELARANPHLGLSRVAILCALNMADELAKMEEQYQRVLGLLEHEWERRRQEIETITGSEDEAGQAQGSA